MSSTSPGAFVAHLSWQAVEQRIQAGATAVLPVGAACKAHGPHLPMNADQLQADWLASALVQRANVLIWPTIAYGYYPAFRDYPGSVSLTRKTFQRLVREILEEIECAGVHAIVIINTGISTIAPLQAVVDRTPESACVLLANVYSGPRYKVMEQAIQEQPSGGHADEIETSIMLAVGREYVALDKAEAWIPADRGTHGAFSRTDPDDPRFSPAGIWGDPTLASEDKGRRLLAAMVDDLLAVVEGCSTSAPGFTNGK